MQVKFAYPTLFADIYSVRGSGAQKCSRWIKQKVLWYRIYVYIHMYIKAQHACSFMCVCYTNAGYVSMNLRLSAFTLHTMHSSSVGERCNNSYGTFHRCVFTSAGFSIGTAISPPILRAPPCGDWLDLSGLMRYRIGTLNHLNHSVWKQQFAQFSISYRFRKSRNAIFLACVMHTVRIGALNITYVRQFWHRRSCGSMQKCITLYAHRTAH
jgi:hypothetical protein